MGWRLGCGPSKLLISIMPNLKCARGGSYVRYAQINLQRELEWQMGCNGLRCNSRGHFGLFLQDARDLHRVVHSEYLNNNSCSIGVDSSKQHTLNTSAIRRAIDQSSRIGTEEKVEGALNERSYDYCQIDISRGRDSPP